MGKEPVIPKPRAQVISILNLQQVSAAVSIFDKWHARNVIGKAVIDLRHTISAIKKFEHIAESNQAMKATELHNSIIQEIGLTIGYVVRAYDTTANLISFLINKILPRMLALRYIPSNKGFKAELPAPDVRKAVVTLADVIRSPYANVSPIDKFRDRREIVNAMKNLSKTENLLSVMEKEEKSLTAKKYQDILAKFKARGTKKNELTEEEKALLKAVSGQSALILNFAYGVSNIIKEYDDIAFLEADICKNLKELLNKDIEDVNRLLLPPAGISKSVPSIENYLNLFIGWLVIARKDMISLQDKLNQKITNENKERFLQYREFMFALLSKFSAWLDIARRDQIELENEIKSFLPALQRLSIT